MTKKNKNLFTFQQSINRITEIVEIMEDGNCELEDMISIYQEGIELINNCNTKLKNTQIKIDQINQSQLDNKEESK